MHPGKQASGYTLRSCRKQTLPQAMARALREMRLMRRTIILAAGILMIVAADGLAQPAEQDPTIRELRNQLEEMRSQMVTMQNRIATLEAAKGIRRGSLTTRRDEDRRRTDGISLQGTDSHSRWFSEINSSGARSE